MYVHMSKCMYDCINVCMYVCIHVTYIYKDFHRSVVYLSMYACIDVKPIGRTLGLQHGEWGFEPPLSRLLSNDLKQVLHTHTQLHSSITLLLWVHFWTLKWVHYRNAIILYRRIVGLRMCVWRVNSIPFQIAYPHTGCLCLFGMVSWILLTWLYTARVWCAISIHVYLVH